MHKCSLFSLALFSLSLAANSTLAQTTPSPCLPAPKAAKSKDNKTDRDHAKRARAHAHPEREYDMACATYAGEIIRGPRTIIAEDLNVLRYDYKWNSTVSFQAAPDLWSKLTSVGTTPGAGSPPANPPANQPKGLSGAPSPDIQTAISNAQTLIDDTEKQIKPVLDAKSSLQANLGDLQTQQALANAATVAVTNAGTSLKSFLTTGSGTPAQIIAGVKDQLTDTDSTTTPRDAQDSIFTVGLKATWADPTTVAALSTSSRALTPQLGDVKTSFASYLPHQSAVLESAKADLNALINKFQQKKSQTSAVQQEIEQLTAAVNRLSQEQTNLAQGATVLNWDIATNSQITAALPDLDSSGSKYSSFKNAQDLLLTWKRRMQDLLSRWTAYEKDSINQPNPFTSQISADCQFAFSRTKQTTLTLSQVDLLPGSTSTSPTTILSVIVECTSPFTVSAGVAFSSVSQKGFAIQPAANPPGSTTTTNEFVLTSDSSFHPLPIAMVHVRMYEPNELFAIHLGFGIAGSFQSQNAGGSSAEFLVGPSFSLFRTMFFTPGIHIGRKVDLGSGFSVNDPVPSNITTPPLKTSYTPGFGFAITFTKP